MYRSWNAHPDLVAFRFQKGKIMLLVALASWILFTVPIGFLHPPVVSCKMYNGTHYLLQLPKDTYSREKRSLEFGRQFQILDDDDAMDEVLTPESVDELPRALPLETNMHHHFG